MDLLAAIIAKLPALREHGVTHVSVDPSTGAVSMLIAPLPVVHVEPEQPAVATYDDGSTYSLAPGTPMPRSFKERLQSSREVK